MSRLWRAAMAKHWIEHRCTKCGNVVGATTQRRPTIGRPFEECAPCGTYVARTPFEEWALMKRGVRTSLVFGSLGRALALGLAPGLVASAIALVFARPSDLQIGLGLLALGALVTLGAWSAWLGRLISGSHRRMNDPWYQAKLAEFAIQSNRRERFSGPPTLPGAPSRAAGS